MHGSTRCSTTRRRARTLARRRADYVEAQQILARDLPAFNLWYRDTVVVHNRRLTHVVPSPSGSYHISGDSELAQAESLFESSGSLKIAARVTPDQKVSAALQADILNDFSRRSGTLSASSSSTFCRAGSSTGIEMTFPVPDVGGFGPWRIEIMKSKMKIRIPLRSHWSLWWPCRLPRQRLTVARRAGAFALSRHRLPAINGNTLTVKTDAGRRAPGRCSLRRSASSALSRDKRI